MQDPVRQVIAEVFALFTRRPFYILIPILAGAVIGPVFAGIGFGAQCAGFMALVVIAALMLYLGNATVRRICHRTIAALRESH
jgi:hypothetical protein